MRTVVQRVTHASVSIDSKVKSKINKGLLILVGIEEADTFEDINWLCKKIAQLRIFDDEDGVMNLSVKDIGGEILAISQFTLFAKTKKGNHGSKNSDDAVWCYCTDFSDLELFGECTDYEFPEQARRKSTPGKHACPDI